MTTLGQTAAQLAPAGSDSRKFLERLELQTDVFEATSATNKKTNNLFFAIDEYWAQGNHSLLPKRLESFSKKKLCSALQKTHAVMLVDPLEYAVVSHRFAAALLILSMMVKEHIEINPKSAQKKLTTYVIEF